MMGELHTIQNKVWLWLVCAIIGLLAGTITLTKDHAANAYQVTTAENVVLNGRWLNPKPQGNDLLDIDCFSSGCVAVGGGGTILTSGASVATWSVRTLNPARIMYGVDCPTDQFCIVVGNGFYVSHNGGVTWTEQTSPSNDIFLDVSCPTSTTCYAITMDKVYVSPDGGLSWLANTLDPERELSSISCPGDLTCYVTGDITQLYTFAHVYITNDGGDTWTTHELDTAGPVKISCGDNSNCVVVSGWGGIIVTHNGGANWYFQFFSEWLYGVSCVKDTGNCMAVGRDGEVWITTNAGDDWTTQSTDTLLDLYAVSCAFPTTCVAVGDAGVLLPTVDGGASWFQVYYTVTNQELHDISCSTPVHCLVVGTLGTIVETDDAGETWTLPEPNSNAFLNAVSCPSDLVCVAVGRVNSEGQILTSNDGGHFWLEQNVDTVENIIDISCGTQTNCIVVGGAYTNTLLMSTDSGNTWMSRIITETHLLRNVSCPTISDCYIVGGNGAMLATHSGGSIWQVLDLGTNADLLDIECPTADRCLVSGLGEMLRTIDGGIVRQRFTEYGDLKGLDCATSEICYARMFDGKVNSIVWTEDFGLTWIVPTSGYTMPGNAMECVDPKRCFTVGGDGHIVSVTVLLPGNYLPLISKP